MNKNKKTVRDCISRCCTGHDTITADPAKKEGTFIMKGIKSFRRTFLLIAALYLACGISLLVWPAQSGLVICYVFGGISLLYGAVQIIRYCCNAAVSIFRYELVTGILCCAFGLFVILRADMVLAVLPFVFGCAIVFDSVMTLQNAIDLRRLGFSR